MNEIDFVRRQEVGTHLAKMGRKDISYLRVLEDDKEMDVGYKNFVWNTVVEEERMESKKKPRKKYKEHDEEEENDPQYELFLKCLKKHGKSYMVEGEVHGSPVIVIYEMDEPYDVEPIRKVRAAMKQKTPSLDQMSGVEYRKKIKKKKIKEDYDFDYSTYMKSLKRRESKEIADVEYKKKIKKEKKKEDYDFDYGTYMKSLKRRDQKEMAGVEYRKAKEDDCDYVTYLRNVKAVNDHLVLKYGGLTVVYDSEDEKNCHENEERLLGYTSKKKENHRVFKNGACKVAYELKDEKNYHENEEKLLGYTSKKENPHGSKYGARKVVHELKDEKNDLESEDSDDNGSSSDEDFMYDSKDEKSNHKTEDSDDESFSDEESLGCKKGDRDFSMAPPKDGENNQVKEEYSDGYSSEVEILESSFVEKKGSLRPTDNARQKGSKFRQKVIAVLRKPYNKSEYDSLWQDVKHRKPKERHLELRNGRERAYSVEKDGKSYLDHYPGLERKLLIVQGDKPKRLNLLRGFFFWLKYLQQPGSFCPWEDDECLAITPKSS